MPTPIMTKEQMKRYVFDRKLPAPDDPLGQDDVLGNLKHMFLHNGYVGIDHFLKENYTQRGKEVIAYLPKESYEPHFFVPADGHLHAVNARGLTRFSRDVLQIDFLRGLTGAQSTIHHYGESLDTARDRFRHLAREKVEEIFSGFDSERIKEQKALYMFCGPMDVHLFRQGKPPGFREHPYLNHQLLDLGGKSAVHLDYLFGDQIQFLFEELFFKSAAAFGNNFPVHLFHDGKYGGLQGRVNDALLPSSVIAYNTIAAGGHGPAPIHNQLVRDGQAREIFLGYVKKPREVTSVHMNSVLDQTKEEVALAKKHGQVMDMELLLINNTAKNAPQPVLVYASGVVSDRPDKGEPLSSSNYDSSKLRNHFAAFYSIVSNHKA